MKSDANENDVYYVIKPDLECRTLDEWLKSDANENETHYVIEPDLECRWETEVRQNVERV